MYKRQVQAAAIAVRDARVVVVAASMALVTSAGEAHMAIDCLLYTSDAADERSSVDLGGRRIIKKKNRHTTDSGRGCSPQTNRRRHGTESDST